MKTVARILAVLLLVTVIVAPAAALASSPPIVVATEEPAPEDEVSEEPQFPPGQEPAEIAPSDAAEEEEQPWTARFLAPTLLLIGVLALVASLAYYGVRVRSRYEVVD